MNIAPGVCLKPSSGQVFVLCCRYSFDLCGFEAAESAVLEASCRGSRGRCEQPTVVDNFLSQQEKKQKHRRKRKCLQSRDHLHFLSELEEVSNQTSY